MVIMSGISRDETLLHDDISLLFEWAFAVWNIIRSKESHFRDKNS